MNDILESVLNIAWLKDGVQNLYQAMSCKGIFKECIPPIIRLLSLFFCK